MHQCVSAIPVDYTVGISGTGDFILSLSVAHCLWSFLKYGKDPKKKIRESDQVQNHRIASLPFADYMVLLDSSFNI